MKGHCSNTLVPPVISRTWRIRQVRERKGFVLYGPEDGRAPSPSARFVSPQEPPLMRLPTVCPCPRADVFAGLLAFALVGLVGLRTSPGAAGADLELTYTLEKPGKVSLLVTDGSGRVVRELLHAAPREAGRQREAWDGLDERGQPVPAGTYQWKLLSSNGLKSEYMMSLGATCVPPWKQMPGNHGGVASVAVDAAGGVFLVASCSEGPPQIVKQSLDGTRRDWDAEHVFDGWQGGVASAVLGDTLYSLQPAGVVIAIDAATGKRKARWELWWDKDEKPSDDVSRLAIDLAGRGDQLAMAFEKHDAVRWIDPATGKVIDEAAVPAPRSVAVAADGRVFVLTNDTVVMLTRSAKTPVAVIKPGVLSSAYRLDVCPETGDIIVVDRGEGNRIKRFSAAGKLLHTLGRAGGRRQGAYEPADFGTVFDLTADGTGGFFVCETWDPPRRTARFDREGKLVAEWYGGQMYANHAVADPADPTIVWVDSHFGSIFKAKVDYAAKTWKVLATYTFGGMAEGFIPSTTHGGGRFVVRHHDGHTYLCRDDTPVVLREDEAGRRLVPLVASQYSIWHAWRTGYLPPLVKEVLQPDPEMRAKPHEQQPFARDAEKAAWLWSDLDGDSRPQAAEIRFGRFPSWFLSRWYVDDQLNYHRYETGLDEGDVLQTMPVTEWTATGAPVYAGWIGITKIPSAMPDWLRATKGDYGARGRIGCVGIWPDGDGGWFGAFNDGNNGFGMGFMSAKVSANRVVRWDASGKLLWDVGRHSPDLGVRPGEARSFFRTAGVAHGCVVVTDIECYYDVKNLTYVWDRDGLWVGRLLENPNTKVAPAAAYTLCTENFGGSLIEITPNMKVPGLNAGDVVFFGSGQNDTRVYRITGWDTIRRQTGTVDVPEGFAATARELVDREARRPDVARIGRVGIAKVDASLEKWKKTNPLSIRMGDTELARLYLGWNTEGLHACFDVTTDRPWKSRSAVNEAFTGGAAVDVNIGPLAAPDPAAPAAGAMRYVAAPIGERGGPKLVEFLPRLLPGMPPQKQPVVFETAAQGKVSFERVAACPAGQVAAKPKTDGAGNETGYVIEMKIPIRGPLEPRPGHRFRFDASVILADAIDGEVSDARIPWHSRAPDDQLVAADQVIEATLRPANWGEAVLE